MVNSTSINRHYFLSETPSSFVNAEGNTINGYWLNILEYYEFDSATKGRCSGWKVHSKWSTRALYLPAFSPVSASFERTTDGKLKLKAVFPVSAAAAVPVAAPAAVKVVPDDPFDEM